MLTLSEALKSNKLNEFIDQQESSGIGPISETAFLSASQRVIRPSQQLDQTSRLPLNGDLTEK
jgi:hypothetical protein